MNHSDPGFPKLDFTATATITKESVTSRDSLWSLSSHPPSPRPSHVTWPGHFAIQCLELRLKHVMSSEA